MKKIITIAFIGAILCFSYSTYNDFEDRKLQRKTHVVKMQKLKQRHLKTLDTADEIIRIMEQNREKLQKTANDLADVRAALEETKRKLEK